MADALSAIPVGIWRDLFHSLEKRRNDAATKLGEFIKPLVMPGDHATISAVISSLTKTLTNSNGSTTDRRKGCLIGLAAVVISLIDAGAAYLYLREIVPPVIASFYDEDNGVRYHASKALLKIAKKARGKLIEFFNQIFDALCVISADSDSNVRLGADHLDVILQEIVSAEAEQFSIEGLMSLVRERMNDSDPYVRLLLLGWIVWLYGIPVFDNMIEFLHDILGGLFDMLSDDSHHGVRQKAEAALSEFLQEIIVDSPSVDFGRVTEILVWKAVSPHEFTRLTAVMWIDEFVELCGRDLLPYYPQIIGAILPRIADEDQKIRVNACYTNGELIRVVQAHHPAEGFDVGAILSMAWRQVLSSETFEATKIEALRWIVMLSNTYRGQKVLTFLSESFGEYLDALLSNISDEVVLLLLEVHGCIAKDQHEYFHELGIYIVDIFRVETTLIEKRCALIIRKLCALLGAVTVYRELSTIILQVAGSDLDFISTMVHELNWILLTASETSELRALLKQSLVNAAGKDLFMALYALWCHSPMAMISLCLLAHAYPHATSVIKSFVEEEDNITGEFLIQLDKLVHLLEAPTFAYLRMQLLRTDNKHQSLSNLLEALLTLVPQQTEAFKILRTRLKTVHIPCISSYDSKSTEDNGIDFASLLQQFGRVQQKHRLHSLV